MLWNFCLLFLICLNAMLSLGQTGIRSKCLKNNAASEECDETMMQRYPELSNSADNKTKADTYIYLFTRNNPEDPEFLHDCGASLPPGTNFDKEARTIIVIHGYLEDICNFAYYREMKIELLKRGAYNAILIDYSWGNRGDYHVAIENGRIVAKQLATLIRNIMNDKGVSLKDFYLIGHSLGAQIAGLTAKELSGTPGKLGRITGLDPAGPGFPKSLSIKDKLDKSDALMVDIIHANAGCLPNFGINYTTGHADFYVNGGSVQLSCYTDLITEFLKGDFLTGLSSLLPPKCYHSQSVFYFKASINPDNCIFVGVHCQSYEDFIDGKCNDCEQDGSNCAIMGFDFDKNYDNCINGIGKNYYLKTSLVCPYCDNSKLNLHNFLDKSK